MYFDSFALTVALHLYTWALAIIAVIAAVAVPPPQQQQLMRQSFTFQLLGCNKTSLYCMRWSQMPHSTHSRLCYRCISEDSFIGSTKRLCLFGTFQRAHFAYAHTFIWFCPFVFVCSFAVCTSHMVHHWIQLYMLSNPLTLHTNNNINSSSSTRSRQSVMNKKDNKRKKTLRSQHRMIKAQRTREYKNIKR